MTDVQQLVTDQLDVWASAIKRKSTAGRGSSKKIELYGIQKLRESILELAARGLLVPQDPADEPASELLTKIVKEKAKLVREGKIRKEKPLPEISDEQKPFILPMSWEWCRLGTIGNIFNGNSVNASIKEDKYTNIPGRPFIATKDVGYGFGALDYANGVCIPLDEAGFKIANKGAVLICAEGGSAGKKCGIADREICFGNKLFAIELFGAIDPRFVLSTYLTPTFFTQFSSSMNGIIGGISSAKFAALIVPIAPAQEQLRIVIKINELMALCDQLEHQTEVSLSVHQTLVETLLTALTNAVDHEQFEMAWHRITAHFDILFTSEGSIEQLKQTILQLAVMGQLVPQDPSEEPASELLKKIAAEKIKLLTDGKIKKEKPLPPIGDKEKSFPLPSGWEWCRLLQATESERDISYGIIKLEAEPVSGGIPTLRCSDVKPGYIRTNDVRTVAPEIEAPYKRTRLQGGEVLVNIRGTLGGAALVPLKLANYNIAREVAMLPIHAYISGSFVVTTILSPFFWNMIESNLKGIAYKGLSLELLSQFVIPIPPRCEQDRIVNKVNEMMDFCDSLKVRMNEAQATKLHLADAMTEQALAG